jgi:tripartite ATP-independent transporter DctM subunit
MILLFVVMLLSLIFIGMPVAFALAGTGMAIMIWQGIFNPTALGHMMYGGLDSFPLLAIPFFMLAGAIMEEAKITKRLMDLAYSIVGRFTGGLAQVAVLMTMIFATMAGSAVATAAAISVILLPTMEERGYKREFSAALTASSSAIGPIFPPSVMMIIYAVIASTSVERMFLGGVIPGLIFGVLMMVYCAFYAKKNNLPKETESLDFKTFLGNLKRAILPMFLPFIILGGIFSGTFTATESSVVAVMYALFLGVFVYRTIKITSLPRIFSNAVKMTAGVMFILAACAILNWVLTSQQIPQQMASIVMSMSTNPTVVIMLIMLLIMVMALFIDGLALILMLAPMCLIVTNSLGIDPVYFGVLMVINVAIGATTPPVGACLFVASKIGNADIAKTSIAIIPMCALAVFMLFLCVIFPDIILWLPSRVLG